MEHKITPAPTDDEATAIATALVSLWPQPASAPEPEMVDTRWRFSGRWWSRNDWRPPTWRR